MTDNSPSKSSVIGVMFNHDRSQVLLIKRRDVPIWVLPGGGIDPNETAEEAIKREFLEETGLTVDVKRKVALFTPINRLTFPTHFFECSFVAGAFTTGAETQGIRFFPLDQLPSPCFFLHQEWIEEAKDPTAPMIHKPLSQITYLNLLKYLAQHPLQVIRLILSRCGIPFNSKTST